MLVAVSTRDFYVMKNDACKFLMLWGGLLEFSHVVSLMYVEVNAQVCSTNTRTSKHNLLAQILCKLWSFEDIMKIRRKLKTQISIS